MWSHRAWNDVADKTFVTEAGLELTKPIMHSTITSSAHQYRAAVLGILGQK